MENMELAATKTAEVVAKSMGLDEMKTAEINMALIEACINAFEHSKSKENIYITYSIDGDTLTIKVGDKGEGFDSEVVAIPNIDEKINSEHKRGWGLQLMKELMDTVEFESSESGTTVTMTKNKCSRGATCEAKICFKSSQHFLFFIIIPNCFILSNTPKWRSRSRHPHFFGDLARPKKDLK